MQGQSVIENRAAVFPPPHESVTSQTRLDSGPQAAQLKFGDWFRRLLNRAFVIVLCVAFVAGFVIKRRELFVPGEGVGYILGIVGGSSMLLLLAYPLIKRTALFRDGSKSAFWFKWHMILGIVGPLLILYHSNFSTGATNSNVALFSMIVVAISGIMGRYIYSRVHLGLYGAKVDLGALLAKATRLLREIEVDVGGAHGLVAKELAAFSEKVMPAGKAQTTITAVQAMLMPIRARVARDRIMRQVRLHIRLNAKTHGWSRNESAIHLDCARRDVDEFLGAVSRAAHMSFWERMFSLWHVLHVPLFFLLIVSGVVHVVAVHLY